MKDQLRKRMFKKRVVRRLKLTIMDGLSIELNSYALIRPTIPGKHSSHFVAERTHLVKLAMISNFLFLFHVHCFLSFCV